MHVVVQGKSRRYKPTKRKDVQSISHFAMIILLWGMSPQDGFFEIACLRPGGAGCPKGTTPAAYIWMLVISLAGKESSGAKSLTPRRS